MRLTIGILIAALIAVSCQPTYIKQAVGKKQSATLLADTVSTFTISGGGAWKVGRESQHQHKTGYHARNDDTLSASFGELLGAELDVSTTVTDLNNEYIIHRGIVYMRADLLDSNVQKRARQILKWHKMYVDQENQKIIYRAEH